MSSSPEKKRRKKLSPESNSLPNDLIVTILARLSRSYYPKLSLVSKTFRAILASPELYQTRILLSRTETFLYVCLSFPGEPNPGWFTLYRKPNQTLTTKKKKNSVHLLAPILNSPPVEFPSLIAVGSYLYAFRAAIEEGSPFSNLWFLDCRTHTWLEAPRMRLALTNSDLDGYMYLAGTSDSLNCVEVYNTDTQTWIPVPPNKRIFKLQHMKGMLYMNVSKLLSFVAQDAEELAPLFPKLRSLLSTEVVAFKPKCIKFRWRRRQGGVWRSLVGLEGLPKFARYSSVKLADCGGKLVVLWHKYVPASGYEEKMVWCAEISLEKRSKKEIWGKIEWFDAVLRVPKYYQFVGAKSATV
ncbi:F-box domain [Arabidopsis suecica]|uniref:F-box domain n=1 Tax=Arabidopsis suecica TaxID=45249 RepID=A0A8T2FYI3_ARASU|nr:F-box domain [Arabidopsis suecica]